MYNAPELTVTTESSKVIELVVSVDVYKVSVCMLLARTLFKMLDPSTRNVLEPVTKTSTATKEETSIDDTLKYPSTVDKYPNVPSPSIVDAKSKDDT